jgi:hypothetical protein
VVVKPLPLVKLLLPQVVLLRPLVKLLLLLVVLHQHLGLDLLVDRHPLLDPHLLLLVVLLRLPVKPLLLQAVLPPLLAQETKLLNYI